MFDFVKFDFLDCLATTFSAILGWSPAIDIDGDFELAVRHTERILLIGRPSSSPRLTYYNREWRYIPFWNSNGEMRPDEFKFFWFYYDDFERHLYIYNHVSTLIVDEYARDSPIAVFATDGKFLVFFTRGVRFYPSKKGFAFEMGCVLLARECDHNTFATLSRCGSFYMVSAIDIDWEKELFQLRKIPEIPYSYFNARIFVTGLGLIKPLYSFTSSFEELEEAGPTSFIEKGKLFTLVNRQRTFCVAEKGPNDLAMFYVHDTLFVLRNGRLLSKKMGSERTHLVLDGVDAVYAKFQMLGPYLIMITEDSEGNFFVYKI